MVHHPIASSDLRAVGYDATPRILEVEFPSGGIYEYVGVTGNTYSGLMQAGPNRRYFHAFIKDGYAYQKVG